MALFRSVEYANASRRMGKVKNYQQEVAQANYPDIRLMTVSNTISLSPSQEFTAVGGGWQVCSSVTIREFSATAYFSVGK